MWMVAKSAKCYVHISMCPGKQLQESLFGRFGISGPHGHRASFLSEFARSIPASSSTLPQNEKHCPQKCSDMCRFGTELVGEAYSQIMEFCVHVCLDSLTLNQCNIMVFSWHTRTWSVRQFVAKLPKYVFIYTIYI